MLDLIYSRCDMAVFNIPILKPENYSECITMILNENVHIKQENVQISDNYIELGN